MWTATHHALHAHTAQCAHLIDASIHQAMCVRAQLCDCTHVCVCVDIIHVCVCVCVKIKMVDVSKRVCRRQFKTSFFAIEREQFRNVQVAN